MSTPKLTVITGGKRPSKSKPSTPKPLSDKERAADSDEFADALILMCSLIEKHHPEVKFDGRSKASLRVVDMFGTPEVHVVISPTIVDFETLSRKAKGLKKPVNCRHPRKGLKLGPRMLGRWGTWPTEVCGGCGSWRILGHKPGPFKPGPVPSRRDYPRLWQDMDKGIVDSEEGE